MKEYWLNEGSLLLPEYWQDKTVNAFIIPSAKDSDVAEVSFVISRDASFAGDDVEHYADTQLVEAAKKLSRYKLVERRKTVINKQPAMEVDYTWLSPDRIEVWQRQAYVKHENLFLIFTLTTRAKEFDRYKERWTKLIDSVQLRASEV